MEKIKAPSLYRTKGFIHTLIKECEFALIYEKSDKNEVSQYKCYEVFKRKIKIECRINGKLIPAHLKLPGNEVFGQWAWSYYTLDKAIAKFSRI